jgi:transketolase
MRRKHTEVSFQDSGMPYRKLILDMLVPYFERDRRYHLLVGDMGFSAVDKLKDRFPERVTNCGIMEQGMVGIAAGMALGGMIPVVYSIVNFLCFRALEQVRNDIALQGLNVKLIGTGAEDYFSFLGPSHTCGKQDILLMETVGVEVFDPYSGRKNFPKLVDKWAMSQKAGYIRV